MSLSDKLVSCNKLLLHEFIVLFYVVSVIESGKFIGNWFENGVKIQLHLDKNVTTFWSKCLAFRSKSTCISKMFKPLPDLFPLLPE